MRLYRVIIAALPVAAWDWEGDATRGDGLAGDRIDPTWTPDGWLSDPDERAAWIERHGDDRFYWPSTSTIYRSRSAAQARADLIEAYGAKAEVYVTETSWRSLAEVKANRQHAAREKKIAALRAQIAELEAS